MTLLVDGKMNEKKRIEKNMNRGGRALISGAIRHLSGGNKKTNEILN
jgi:hypothetical protein